MYNFEQIQEILYQKKIFGSKKLIDLSNYNYGVCYKFENDGMRTEYFFNNSIFIRENCDIFVSNELSHLEEANFINEKNKNIFEILFDHTEVAGIFNELAKNIDNSKDDYNEKSIQDLIELYENM